MIQYNEFLDENEKWLKELVEETNETKVKKENAQNEFKILIQRLDAVRNAKKSCANKDSLEYIEKVYDKIFAEQEKKEKELLELEILHQAQNDLINGLNSYKEEYYPVK